MYKGANIKTGFIINGHDVADLDPGQVMTAIHKLPKDQKAIVMALLETKMYDTDFPLADNYASKYGRPSLKEKPFMTCESDGYPYLDGHAPNCNGKIDYGKEWIIDNKGRRELVATKCWCRWVGYVPREEREVAIKIKRKTKCITAVMKAKRRK